MHRQIFITAALAALALAACQRHSQETSEAKDTGASLGAAAKDVAHDPNVKRAEADIKALSRDLGADARSSASDARAASQDLSDSAKRASHDIRDRAKRWRQEHDADGRDRNG
jgi:hypothetical protein